jgi:hypothetical protein
VFIETTSNKNVAINIFKAMLIIGMVISHSLQILAPATVEYIAVEYFNIITFAGFIFSFGYVYEQNYGHKETSWKFVFRKLKVTLVAFYVSAIVFRLCLGPFQGVWSIVKILLLLDVPYFTEYILAFTFTSVLYFLCRKYIQQLLKRQWYFFIVIVLLFALSYVPFYQWYPTIVLGGKEHYFHYYIGLLFGSQKVQYFPVIPYFPVFLLGIWFKRYQVYFSWKVLLTSLLCTLLFCYYSYIKQQPPSKWPPTFVYIGGSFFAIYIYYLVAGKIAVYKFAYWLNIIGNKSIVYLIVSNLVIFFAATLKNYSVYEALYIAVCILLITTIVLQYVSYKKVNIRLSRTYILEE